MDTHKQLDAHAMRALQIAIDEDDPTALSLAVESAALDVGRQTPYMLAYDADYDAGYLLEGPAADGFMVFRVQFLDGVLPSSKADDDQDTTLVDADIAAGAAASGGGRGGGSEFSHSSAAGAANAGGKVRRGSLRAIEEGRRCLCAHYAAIRGSLKCFEWILQQPGARSAALSLAHHSGCGVEELASDAAILGVVLALEDDIQSGKSSTNSKDGSSPTLSAASEGASARTARAALEVALHREQRAVNQLKGKLSREKAEVQGLRAMLVEAQQRAEAQQLEVQQLQQLRADQSKAIFDLQLCVAQRERLHQASLDTVTEVVGRHYSGSGSSSASVVDFLSHMLGVESARLYPVTATAPVGKTWTPSSIELLSPKKMERTPFYKLVGPRMTKSNADSSSCSPQTGRIQPINFDADSGVVKGNNGVAFRAIDRHGQQVVLRGILPDQPYQYTHGMHPNVLGVLHRFRGSSALIRPWVKNSESIPDNVECVSNHDCLSSRIHFLVTRRREACCRCKFPEPFFTRYTVVQFYGSVLSSLESLPRRLNSRDVASILSQVCLGLSYLQDTFGVQHNDVHENHVFVTPSGFLKIGGFNMASHSSTTAQSDGAFVSSDVFKLGQMILRLGGDKPAQRFAARKDFDARPHSVDNVPMLPRTIAPALRCLVQQMLDWDITQRPSLDTVIATTCDVLFQDSSIDTRGGISSQGLAKLALQQKEWLLTSEIPLENVLDAGFDVESKMSSSTKLEDPSVASPQALRYLRGVHLQRIAKATRR